MSEPQIPTNPTPTEAPKTLEQVRKEAYADSHITADEFRKIVEKAVEDGLTKDEKSKVKTDMAKAIQDNPDAATRTEIAGIAQMALTNKEILSKFLYVVGALLGFGLLSWLIQLCQMYTLLMK
jgi:hypothetical protein